MPIMTEDYIRCLSEESQQFAMNQAAKKLDNYHLVQLIFELGREVDDLKDKLARHVASSRKI